MKKRLSAICFATILLVSFSMIQTSNAAVASIYVSPSKSTAWPLNTVGGHGYNTFQTEIKVSDVVDLFSWQFWFHWNPAVANLTGYTEGSFLKGPFSYQTYPKVSAGNDTVTNPTYAYDENIATYSNLTYGQQISAIYDLYPDDYKANITVTTPQFAIDRDNATKASFAYAQQAFEAPPGGNFTMYNFEVGSGTIQQVDLKMRFNITAATDDQYRIVYYVLPSTAKQVLIGWTSSAQALNTVTWANRAEPNDGTWSWTDIHNINFMIETNRVGSFDNKRIDVWEAWATVRAQSNVGSFRMASFGIPWTSYPIDRVDLKLRYSAEAASDDQYRIQYYVTPSTTTGVLQDWTSTAKALDTYTWSGITEPIDGTWSWTDVSNLNFEIATKITGASDNKQIRVYEAWAVVKYHRATSPTVTLDYLNGYIFYGSTVLAPSDGATGSGTIAILRFKVLTSAASPSPLDFDSPATQVETKLINSGGGLITHTRTNGSLIVPPWVEDINGDGYVDIQDIALVGMGWGKTSADPNWATKYKDADVNKDNKIDVSDLSAVALKWSYGSYL